MSNFKAGEHMCGEENACFKTLEVTSFGEAIIGSFSTILQEEILIFSKFLEISIIERANKLQNVFDVIKQHCSVSLPSYILQQTGSIFTNLLMPWSDLNLVISINKNSKNIIMDEVLENFLTCMRSIPGMVRDYKHIKTQAYGILKV